VSTPEVTPADRPGQRADRMNLPRSHCPGQEDLPAARVVKPGNQRDRLRGSAFAESVAGIMAYRDPLVAGHFEVNRSQHPAPAPDQLTRPPMRERERRQQRAAVHAAHARAADTGGRDASPPDTGGVPRRCQVQQASQVRDRTRANIA
jgi:hypothetical protein